MDSSSTNTPSYKQPNFCFKLVESATPEQLAEARKQLHLRTLEGGKSSPITTMQTQTRSSTQQSLLPQTPSPSSQLHSTTAYSNSLAAKQLASSSHPHQAPQSHTPTTSPSILPRSTPHLSPESLKRIRDMEQYHASFDSDYSLALRSRSTPESLKRTQDEASENSAATTPITFPAGRPRKKPCRKDRTESTDQLLEKARFIPPLPAIPDERKLLEDSQKMLMDRQAQVIRLEAENKRLTEHQKAEEEQLRAMYERKIMVLKEHHDEEVAKLNTKISLLEEIGLQKEVWFREKEKLAEDLKETVEQLRAERQAAATSGSETRSRKGRGGAGNTDSWKDKFLASEKDADIQREKVAKLEATRAVFIERTHMFFDRFKKEQEKMTENLEHELFELTEATAAQTSSNYSFS